MKYLLLLSSFLLFGCAANQQALQLQLAEMEKVKNYEGMIEIYKDQMQDQPDDFNNIALLATTYYRSGDIESAEFYVEHLLNKKYFNKDVYYLSANINADKEKPHQAIADYHQAESLGFSGCELNMKLGVLHGQQSDFFNAEDQFNQARIKGCDEVSIKNNIAVIYIAQERYNDAMAMLLPLYGKDANEKVKINLAIAAIKSRNYSIAEQVLRDDLTNRELSQLFIRLGS